MDFINLIVYLIIISKTVNYKVKDNLMESNNVCREEKWTISFLVCLENNLAKD